MDNLTHSLTGALIGQCGLKRKTGLAMPALIIGANLPDVDAACFFWLDGVEHLAFRRGITHGPPAWFLLPLVLAGLLYGYDRWQAKRGKRPETRLPVNFTWLYILSLIGCLSHPALDWMNVYGIRLLEPFSSRWFYGDVLFIIDIWLWALLIFSVWFSLRRGKAGGEWMQPARAALAVMLAYIGLNAGITYANERALAGQGDVVIASPPPVMFWQREMIVGGSGRYNVGGEDVGLLTLTDADKPVLATLEPMAAPFLFWSRTPLVRVAEDGSCTLTDARYMGRPTGGFTVVLPDHACAPPPAE